MRFNGSANLNTTVSVNRRALEIMDKLLKRTELDQSQNSQMTFVIYELSSPHKHKQSTYNLIYF